MPSLLIRLVLAEVTRWYAAGVALFLALQLTDALSSTVANLITYKPAFGTAAAAFLSLAPSFLNRSLVLAVPFAILLALARMQSDNELKAISAGGVPPLRLVWPLALPFLLVAAVTYGNANQFAPQGMARWWNTWYGVYNMTPPPPEQLRYTYAPPGALYYAGKVITPPGSDEAQLQGVMVQRGQTILTASTGTWNTRTRTWTLLAPWETRPGQPPRALTGPVTVPQTDRLRPAIIEVEQTTTPVLRGRAADPGLPGTDRREAAFTVAQRTADPVTPIIFALAAGALGLLLRNRAAAFGAVLVFLVGFYVLWTTMPGLARAGAVQPDLAAWTPNLAFLILAAALAWRLR
ncbi:LptF/LptG family permease [Deinococcus sp. JMULE3]|uniref:LptF/LptG family permease n=1 Tax=Deinococcus sp. JMULE3 TaxID=2518341 RepID=UPI0035305331